MNPDPTLATPENCPKNGVHLSPLWTLDGEHILYLGNAGAPNRVAVTTDPEFSASDPVATFDVDASRIGQVMDVTPDGERALVAYNYADGQVETRPRMTVVLNWFGVLEERVGKN